MAKQEDIPTLPVTGVLALLDPDSTLQVWSDVYRATRRAAKKNKTECKKTVHAAFVAVLRNLDTLQERDTKAPLEASASAEVAAALVRAALESVEEAFAEDARVVLRDAGAALTDAMGPLLRTRRFILATFRPAWRALRFDRFKGSVRTWTRRILPCLSFCLYAVDPRLSQAFDVSLRQLLSGAPNSATWNGLFEGVLSAVSLGFEPLRDLTKQADVLRKELENEFPTLIDTPVWPIIADLLGVILKQPSLPASVKTPPTDEQEDATPEDPKKQKDAPSSSTAAADTSDVTQVAIEAVDG